MPGNERRAYIASMIRDAGRLAEFERRYTSEEIGKLTYHDALAIFAAFLCTPKEAPFLKCALVLCPLTGNPKECLIPL